MTSKVESEPKHEIATEREFKFRKRMDFAVLGCLIVAEHSFQVPMPNSP